MSDAQPNDQRVSDANLLRAAAAEKGLAGSRLTGACEQIVAEEKAEAGRIAFEKTKVAVQSQVRQPENIYDRIKNNRF